jgi:protein-S-isoprenylcysteine O-methyltransferase Ste14
MSGEGIMKTVVRALISVPIGLVVFGLLVFWPAGTFDYWQGWTFIAVFAISTFIPSIYLAVKNPEALQRRMHAGPWSETRTVQKIISVVAFGSLAAMIVLSALDFRLGWSTVPAAVSVIGAVLVALGLGIAMLVIIQNAYAAANITVESGQQLTTTGLYALVRHPMYFGNVIMMIGIPLALGSYWGLVFLIPGLLVLGLRINDEEALLRQELDGYTEYTEQVHHRLVPYVW